MFKLEGKPIQDGKVECLKCGKVATADEGKDADGKITVTVDCKECGYHAVLPYTGPLKLEYETIN